MARVGLVAGCGDIPIIFSERAKEMGDTVVAFGLRGVTEETLEKYVDKMHWINWGDLKKALLILAAERVSKIVMLGKIDKGLFFKKGNDGKLDEEARRLLEKIKDKKDYAILNGVEKLLGSIGIKVIDPLTYLKDLIPSKGTLTEEEPTGDEWQDVHYGREMAKELCRFDIGQAVAVKEKTVIAMEALEGTDEMIRRAGSLVEGGFVVVKVARPDQDMRFDIPLVGPRTVKTLIEAKARVLALEEKRTLLADKDEVVRQANENNLSVVVI